MAGTISAAILLFAEVMMRSLLDTGLGPVQEINDSVLATNLPIMLGIVVVAAAAGALVASREDAGLRPALASGGTAAVLTPMLLALELISGPHTANTALVLVLAEVAVAAGTALALAATYRPLASAAAIAATVAALGALTTRAVLNLRLTPGSIYDEHGRITAQALDAARLLHTWVPVAAGAMALAGSAPVLFRVKRLTLPTTAAVSTAPLLPLLAGWLLVLPITGLPSGGPPSPSPTAWWTVAGALTGTATGLALRMLRNPTGLRPGLQSRHGYF